jgi:chromosome segregation ATPase
MSWQKRLSQNRKAQRAHRARQRHHVECLEEQLKTVVGKYENLQQRYSTLSASYERLEKQSRRKETGKNDEEQSNPYTGWKNDEVHVTSGTWRQDCLEDNQFLPANSWQQCDDRGGYM